MKNLKENRIKRKIGRRWLLVVFLCACAMVSTAQVKEGNVHLRANLVRWATLTADGSVEWQLKKEWSVLASGTWSSWSFKGNRYRIKEFAGEIRHYMGYMSTELPWYIGMRIYGGEFNYGFSKEKARQGDLLGGGIIAGYRLHLRNKRFYVDFTGGLGCTNAKYDQYKVLDDTRYITERGETNYWGINHVSVALVYKLFNH